MSEVSRRLADRGCRVSVLTTTVDPGAVGVEMDGRVAVHRVRARPRRSDVYVAPALPVELRRLDADLVHVQGYHTAVAPAAMATALVARVPYVLSLHSGGHSSALRRTLRPLQHRVLRPLIRRSQRVVAVSDFELERLAAALAIDRERALVIPNGVDPVFSASVPSQRSTTPTVASIGRLEWFKGHHLVMRALPHLAQRIPDVQLIVVGEGPIEARLRALADELGVAHRVSFRSIPYADRRGMAAEMAAADVVALLSSYESQGLVGYEAAAVGARTLVKAGTALAETSDPNAVVVDDDRPSVIAEHLARQIEAGPVAVRPTVPDWDDTTDQLEQVYRDVLGGGS